MSLFQAARLRWMRKLTFFFPRGTASVRSRLRAIFRSSARFWGAWSLRMRQAALLHACPVGDLFHRVAVRERRGNQNDQDFLEVMPRPVTRPPRVLNPRQAINQAYPGTGSHGAFLQRKRSRPARPFAASSTASPWATCVTQHPNCLWRPSAEALGTLAAESLKFGLQEAHCQDVHATSIGYLYVGGTGS